MMVMMMLVVVGAVPSSTKTKPKIVHFTEKRILPRTLAISAMPMPSIKSSLSYPSCSIDHYLTLKPYLPGLLTDSMDYLPRAGIRLNIIEADLPSLLQTD
jgi:hypothetical protein